jgi:hypothetical protein
MPYISAELVTETWQRVGALSPREAERRQRQAGHFQEQVVGFVIGYLAEDRPDVIGLGLYVMLVILEMFQAAPGIRIRKVRVREITDRWAHNRKLATKLSGRGRLDPAAAAVGELSHEPHVFRYLLEAIGEDNQEDPVPLTNDEYWHLAAVLKTVLDVVHGACRRGPRRGTRHN